MAQTELAFAEDLVLQAGEKLKKEFLRKVDYRILDHGELNIPFETEIDAFYRESIAKHYPIADIASKDNERPTIGRPMWTIDAIDGGLNYARHIPYFCTALSLIYDFHVRLAVVYDPIHDELFTACEDRGAHLNGKPIYVSQTSRLDEALVSLTAIEHHPLSISGIFKPMQERAWSVINLPCSILSACYVAAGRFDVHLFNGRRIWDIAPSYLMVKEAGGIVTDPNNKVLDTQEPMQGAVYSNHELHEKLMKFS